MDAVKLVHRHLPLLEPRAFLAFDQLALHQLAESLSCSLSPVVSIAASRLPGTSCAAPARRCHRTRRQVRDLVVIAPVSQRRRKLRRSLQLVFPHLP